MVKVGDKLYYFDTDYARGQPFRERFREYVIVGETRVSWLISEARYIDTSWNKPRTLNKKTMKAPMRGRGYGEHDLLTVEGRDAEIWLNGNRHQISQAYNRCNDPEKLKQIAKILGVATKET